MQFCRNAAVAPISESSCQPGTCCQATAVSRVAAIWPGIIAAPVGGEAGERSAPPPPQDASITATESAPSHAPAVRTKRIQCSFLMETAMSDLFDEYPMLIFALESLLALFLLVFIVVWTSSGKKKATRANASEQPKQQKPQ